MKKLIPYLFFSLILHFTARAQQAFEPQLLILSPGGFTYDRSLVKEVNTKNEEIKKMATEQLRAYISNAGQKEDMGENIKLMQSSDSAFLYHLDFPKLLSFNAQQFLVYRFYEKFPNCLVQVVDERADSTSDGLKKFAVKRNIPYVLNFSSISLYVKNGETFCRLKMQFYDRESDNLLINKEYDGDWNNPGFEFACKQGSIDCAVSNALSQALPDILYQVALNNPTLKKERALAADRAAFIESKIYSRPFNDSLVRKVIAAKRTDIELHELYQCFTNTDNTKFVAFFIKTIDKKDVKSLLTSKTDANVRVITSKDIHDSGYLDQTPRTYAYIVKGIEYDKKWFFNKSEVTYFDAANLKEGKLKYLNNLQQWNYFADNSALPGIGFWDGILFKKIKDKRLDPKWEKYKGMWKAEELENRNYIGMYELVADELKKEKEADDSTFRATAIENIMMPFYNRQSKLQLNHIIKTTGPEAYNLIYPPDKKVILNPIKITDEKDITSIRYFVFIPDTKEVFEWTLAKPYILKKGEYTDEPITRAINAFTSWGYSQKTLNDTVFWNEKILAKDGENYKFLKKIQ